MKGTRVERFGWSPDKTEFYVMTYEPNRDATIKEAYHYVMQVATGQTKSANAAPAWADAYWLFKSDQSAPGDASLTINVAQERKRAETGVATPMGGDLARGGGSDTTGLTVGGAIDASRGMDFHNIYTLTLKGETIGQWTDHRIQPGMTFSWGPKGTGLIVFTEKDSGRLVFMDRGGKKQRIDSTKGVILPAWTEDGSRLAYLEPRGKNRYEVIIADVK